MEDNEIDTFGGKLSLKKETYKYIQHGFEALLYDAGDGDDRLLNE